MSEPIIETSAAPERNRISSNTKDRKYRNKDGKKKHNLSDLYRYSTTEKSTDTYYRSFEVTLPSNLNRRNHKTSYNNEDDDEFNSENNSGFKSPFSQGFQIRNSLLLLTTTSIFLVLILTIF
jgi:hypothetical protein